MEIKINVKSLIGLNQLNKLEDKQEFMESLNISVYNECFSRDGDYKIPITEMKFSNDLKVCFICKRYEGTIKKDYTIDNEESNNNLERIAVFGLVEKDCIWVGWDTEVEKIKYARCWFARYKECYFKTSIF